MEFAGINPAMFTPLTDDGEAVAPERLRRLVRFLLEQGVSGLFVCGSTGEGVLLSPAEREQVAEITLAEVAGQVPVMVHVGAAATRDSVRLARHAAAHGAAAVSSVPPFPFPLSTACALEHWRRIGAATDLPLWIYYLPLASSFRLGAADLEALFALPNLVGMKFTDTDLYVMRNLIEWSGGRLRVLSGPDQLCLPAQVMGATGAIGSTYNWLAPLFVKLYRAYHDGDLATAQRCQYQANALIRVIHRYELIAGQKAIMEYLGVPCGPTRHPIVPVSEEARREIYVALDREGLRDLYA